MVKVDGKEYPLNIIDFILMPLFMLSVPASFVLLYINWLTNIAWLETASKISLFTAAGSLAAYVIYISIRYKNGDYDN